MNRRIDRKELIIHSALQNFMEEGYERATMQDIAIKAGVGKGTIYEYFSSKEELFSEVVLTGINKMCDALTQTLTEPGTIYEKVKRLYEKNIQLFQIEYRLTCHHAERLRQNPEATP